MDIEQRVSKAPSANELANEMAKVLEETRHNIIMESQTIMLVFKLIGSNNSNSAVRQDV